MSKSNFMDFNKIKKIFFIVGVLFFLFAGKAKAASVGDVVNFNVDKSFDTTERTAVSASLVKISDRLYFYIEKSWWDSQSLAKKNEILTTLDGLSNEFDSNIYPTLTSDFGTEWSPGIDNDSRVTILFEQMNSAEGGYFREADEYDKLQIPDSNSREMFYLSLDRIDDSRLKMFLAHEFVHLITFNQKNRIFKVEDETWLNEARADYSSTILGYDNKYDGSELQQRVKDFAENPTDSIAEWTGTKYDYASVSLFTNYLVEHYGVNVLMDSLKSKYVGIDSVNYALQKTGSKDNFGQVFTNWTIASVLNDCSIDQNYCYSNQNLKNLRIAPSLNFLPMTGDISLSVSNVTKNWAGNWLKFIGGDGDLKFDFSSYKDFSFKVPYILEDSSGSHAVKFLILDKNEKGEIDINKFGTDYKFLVVIPSLQTKSSGFEGAELAYPFSYTVRVIGNVVTDDQALIQQLLEKIAALKQEIAKLQSQKGNPENQNFCSQLNKDLRLGMSNDSDVKCLQEFLKNQGVDIYPEGFVTGNFGSLTTAAVTRFQEKYASSILTPVGLLHGTGYVGEQTRIKINQILAGG